MIIRVLEREWKNWAIIWKQEETIGVAEKGVIRVWLIDIVVGRVIEVIAEGLSRVVEERENGGCFEIE